MGNKKIIYLLLVLLLLCVLFIFYLIKQNRMELRRNFANMNLLELIRAGYDLTDDTAFPEICKNLNDSMLSKSSSIFSLSIITSINTIDKTIDWAVVRDDYVTDIIHEGRIFSIDISKNKGLKLQDESNSITNLRRLAGDYLFYPDSATRKRLNKIEYIEGLGEVELSSNAPAIDLHLSKKRGFSVSDWRFFFECLRELIELYEDERNNTSLKIFNKDYASLSFDNSPLNFKL